MLTGLEILGVAGTMFTIGGYSLKDALTWLNRNRHKEVVKALDNTVLEYVGYFPHIRDNMVKFFSDRTTLIQLQELAKNGGDIEAAVSLFISSTDFHYIDDMQTHSKARAILETLVRHLDEELTDGPHGLLHHDKKHSAQLGEVLHHLADQARQSEERFSALDRNVDSVEQKIAEITERFSSGVVFDFRSEQMRLEPPPTVAPVAIRSAAVTRYIEQFKISACVSVVGELGTGKTQLAIQVAERVVECVAWVRLRERGGLEAASHIAGALEAASGVVRGRRFRAWCEQVFSQFEHGALIVLHNVPKITDNDNLAEILVAMVHVAQRHNIRILITTAHKLPQQLRKTLGDQLFEDDIPDFSDGEVAELLRAYGAPPQVLDTALVSLVTLCTSRHPVLLAAAAHYLSQAKWQSLSGLLKGEFASAVTPQVQEWLLATVANEHSRELLYRLVLVGSTFSRSHADRVSAVAPVIYHPHERLLPAIGPWVQRDSAETYTISPLLQTLGSDNLAPETKKHTHIVLGEMHLEKGVLGPTEVLKTISHFVYAQEFRRAGVVYVKALMAFNELRPSSDPWGMAVPWAASPLPQAMGIDLQLAVRSYQISIAFHVGTSTDYLIQDLDRLMQQASTANSLAIVTAAILAGPLQAKQNLRTAARFLLKAVEFSPTVAWEYRLVNGEDMRLLAGLPAKPEELLWFLVQFIHEKSDLLLWMDTFEQFSAEQRTVAINSDLFEETCQYMADGVWIRELKKAPDDRNWSDVFGLLSSLAERANNLGVELLWACFIRAAVIVLAEYMTNVPEALRLATESLEAIVPADPRVTFLVYESMGRQLLYFRTGAEALPWLLKALEQSVQTYPRLRVITMLSTGTALGDSDPKQSLELSRSAADLAKQLEDVNDVTKVKALGELAIAGWLADDMTVALVAMEEAVERLFATREESQSWKSLFMVCGHTLGYLASIATVGAPPTQTQNGGQFLPPSRGLFLRDILKAGNLYDAGNDYAAATQLAMFAEAVGDMPRAAKWSMWGLEAARGSGSEAAIAIVGPTAVAHLLAANSVSDAITVAMQTGAAEVASRRAHEAGDNPLAPGFRSSSVLGAKPSGDWNLAEERAVLYALVPVTLQLALSRKVGNVDQKLLDAVVTNIHRLRREASNPQLWQCAAELFQAIFVSKQRAEPLLALGDELEKVAQTLKAIAFIGASLSLPPSEAARAHFLVIPYLDTALRNSKSLRDLFVMPFVTDFWSQTFAASRFRFSAPSIVETALSQALASDKDRRIKAVLRVIGDALDVRPSPSVRTWLNS